jgi:hypothetical protein
MVFNAHVYAFLSEFEWLKELSWSWSDRMDLQLPMQSVPIATNVVISKPAHGEVYLIKHYVIKFVSDVQKVGDFLRL